MSMLKCEMLKPCSLFPMHKLSTRPLSNVKLKLLDSYARGRGKLGYNLELKTIDFTSLNYHGSVHLCVINWHERFTSVNRKTIGVVMEIHKFLHLRQETITG